MNFVANLMYSTADPGKWARDREAEGWDIVAASDHYFADDMGTNHWFPHLWVTVSQMAAATNRVKITSTFANNLFRSPIEFIQASLTMQRVSGGRWEAGIGAGWNREELERSGQVYPPNRERADRFIEAVKIARQFFDDGGCKFAGEYYQIDVPVTVGYDDVWPPPLIGSLGGSRTIAGATPYLDRIELKGASLATRGGGVDFAQFAQIPRQHLVDLVDEVRRVRDDVPLGFFAFCAAGTDPVTKSLENIFPDPDSLYAGLFGHPEKVAQTLLGLERYGITYPDVSPCNIGTYEALAPYLFVEKK
jgi:alkanesulfonate monooxygenase SsuD/methylene tetrahydromethanopterin reductase-like flavin-dependent oxidoreductase (luciferase family)